MSKAYPLYHEKLDEAYCRLRIPWAEFCEWQTARDVREQRESGACGFGADCPFARGVWGPPDEDSIRAEAREAALAEARLEAREELERVREELERVREERDEAVAENEWLWSKVPGGRDADDHDGADPDDGDDDAMDGDDA